MKEAERKAAERAAAEVEAAKWRNWTTADGQYRVRAKFVSLVNQSITLQKEDGSAVDVPFNVLSREDQQFVTQRKWIRSTKKR